MSEKNILIKFWGEFKKYAKKQNIDINWDKYNYTKKWLKLNRNSHKNISKNTPWFAFIVRDRPKDKTRKKEIACSLTVNPENYEKLDKYRSEIEKTFGHKLKWKENPKMCRIEYSDEMDYKDYNTWMEIFQWYVETANKYINTFKSRLDVMDEKNIIKK